MKVVFSTGERHLLSDNKSPGGVIISDKEFESLNLKFIADRVAFEGTKYKEFEVIK